MGLRALLSPPKTLGQLPPKWVSTPAKFTASLPLLPFKALREPSKPLRKPSKPIRHPWWPFFVGDSVSPAPVPSPDFSLSRSSLLLQSTQSGKWGRPRPCRARLKPKVFSAVVWPSDLGSVRFPLTAVFRLWRSLACGAGWLMDDGADFRWRAMQVGWWLQAAGTLLSSTRFCGWAFGSGPGSGSGVGLVAGFDGWTWIVEGMDTLWNWTRTRDWAFIYGLNLGSNLFLLHGYWAGLLGLEMGLVTGSEDGLMEWTGFRDWVAAYEFQFRQGLLLLSGYWAHLMGLVKRGFKLWDPGGLALPFGFKLWNSERQTNIKDLLMVFLVLTYLRVHHCAFGSRISYVPARFCLGLSLDVCQNILRVVVRLLSCRPCYLVNLVSAYPTAPQHLFDGCHHVRLWSIFKSF